MMAVRLTSGPTPPGRRLLSGTVLCREEYHDYKAQGRLVPDGTNVPLAHRNGGPSS